MGKMGSYVSLFTTVAVACLMLIYMVNAVTVVGTVVCSSL